MSYIGELNADKEIIDGNRKIIIYGIGGYGDKIYRNLAIYDKQKNVMAFVDKSPERYKGGGILQHSNYQCRKSNKGISGYNYLYWGRNARKYKGFRIALWNE